MPRGFASTMGSCTCITMSWTLSMKFDCCDSTVERTQAMNRTLKQNHFYFHLGFSIIFTIYYLSHSISRQRHSSIFIITDRNLKERKLSIQPFHINTTVTI